MTELKVKKRVEYTYETSDGREFDDKKEAMKWQTHLSNIEDVRLLNFEYKPTKEISSAIYVYAKTAQQAESFNAMQDYNGYCSCLPGAGFYRYDDISDSYVDIENEIKTLQHHIDVLLETQKGGTE